MTATQILMGFMLPEVSWTEVEELPDLVVPGGALAVDTETRDNSLARDMGSGWPTGDGRIVGVSVATDRGSVYVPIAHPDSVCHDREKVARWLQHHVDASRHVVFQNIHYDLGWLKSDLDLDAPPHEKLNDTIGMAYMLDEQRLTYNMDALCKWLGIEGKDETALREAARAHGVDPKGGLWRLPARFVGGYAAQDAVATLEMWRRMTPMLESEDVVSPYRTEMELVPMVLAMRRRGIRINVDTVEQAIAKLNSLRDEALDALTSKLMIGRRVTAEDVSSKKFKSKVFADAGLPVPRTDKNNDSFETEWMAKSEHWLPQLCAQVLKLQDASHKFLEGYILGYVRGGRIYPEIRQYKSDDGGTKTSRFAYADPPVQQMPSRDPLIGHIIRSCFEPEKREIWGALDYSQQEYRLIVHFAKLCRVAGHEAPVQMYRENPKTDFHAMVAELTGLPRRKAKDVNFAKAFGAGVSKFALMTGMTLEDAAATMEQYDERAPFVKRLSEFVQNVANSRGYIRLIDGARVRFMRWEPRWIDREKYVGFSGPVGACSWEEARARTEDPRHPWYRARLRRAFTHKAMNWLIQGSAARQTKMAMLECWRSGLVPLIQMHDELDFSFTEESQARRAVECMRDVIRLEVPVAVDAEFGRTWGGASVKKDARGEVVYGATWEEAMAS